MMLPISLAGKTALFVFLVVFILGCRIVYHKDFTYKDRGAPISAARLNYDGCYVHSFHYTSWYAHQNGRKWQVDKRMVRSDSAVRADSARYVQQLLFGPIHKYHSIYYRTGTRDGVYLIFFYRDGSFASDRMEYADIQEAEKYYKTSPREYFYKGNQLDWGRYIVQGDTIKTQFFTFSTYGNKTVEENWYLIMADSSISQIPLASKSPKKQEGRINNVVTDINTPQTFNFVSFPAKPDSSSWVRDKKWYRD